MFKASLILLNLAVISTNAFIFPDTEQQEDDNDTSPNLRTGSTTCVKASDCPAFANLSADGLEEFETCGRDGDELLFDCPESLEPLEKDDNLECFCSDLEDCKPLFDLAKRRKFQELLKFKTCGLDDKGYPRYCCPNKKPKRRVQSVPTDVRDINMRINDDDHDEDEEPDTRSPSNSITTEINIENEEETKLDEQCGFTSINRIFGGSDAEDHEFPWAAALVYIDTTVEPNSRVYLCGGTLISRKHVLTAAHCINSKGNHHLSQVQLGHADLESNESISIDIELVTLHPEYQTIPLLMNDLAILTLSDSVANNDKTFPLCLPRGDEEIIEPVVIGWGLVDLVNSSRFLQKLDVNITGNPACQKTYGNRIPGFAIQDTQICAKGLPGTDSCKGDSGGPLQYLADDGRFRLVGVTSFGTIKCDSSVPGVYEFIFCLRQSWHNL